MRCTVWVSFVFALLALAWSGAHANDAEKLPAEQIEFFERQVRPILVDRCYKCHSAEKKVRGGLKLDTRVGVREGGDQGPAIVPGDPDASLLIEAIRYENGDLQMPPKGKLPEAEIAALVRWVQMGAPDPRGDTASQGAEFDGMSIEEGRRFWSFRPVNPLEPPVVEDTAWPLRKIDRFLLSRLEEKNLTPSAQAARRQLIRRATFDLTGLPPTPAEIDLFLRDDSSKAYPQLLERLLASPRYGEHWGRFWLDKVRYTDKIQSWENSKASLWLYRDWVIKAFNDDAPYDDFVKRQLATDLMPSTGPEDLPALGLLGLSPTYWKELKLDNSLIKGVYAKEWEERMDTIGRTFLGLTLACARCHDHKFDPVKQVDYYAIAGVLASTRQIDRPLLPDHEWETLRNEQEQLRLATLARNKLRDNKAPKEKVEEAENKIKAIEKAIAAHKTVFVRGIEDASVHILPDGKTRTKVEFRRGEPQDLNVHLRGDPTKLGPVVPRRFLTVLSNGEPQPFQKGSGRLELAERIVSDGAPLTSRVIVNRIWEQHFGRGLVDTPSNFGDQGSRPTHPELLSDLAARFIQSGWSIKWLHREIMLSAAYQQSSAHVAAKSAIDPDNRLLWRMNRRRLEIEAWRDSMLAVSGVLAHTSGGAPSELTADDNHRRTVYGLVDRRNLDSMLRLHDFPDPAGHSPRREPTTTPVQQLFVLNSKFLSQQADRLYDRVKSMGETSTTARVRKIYEWMFARFPTPAQVELAESFLASGSDHDATWTQYLHALLSSNEFAFVD